MPWVGFEPTSSAGERPKTYALDRTATGTDTYDKYHVKFKDKGRHAQMGEQLWSSTHAKPGL